MEAELKFERENRSGIAVVGSYLIDAARRLGVDIRDESGRLGLDDSSAVIIKSGAEFLSLPNKAEIEQLSAERRSNGERLASQAKIEKEGEIVLETIERKVEEPEDPHETYREKFADMPLEEKMANLVKLETIALGETFNYVLGAPQAIGGKVVDLMAKFGFKMEEDSKKATEPTAETTAETNGSAKNPADEKKAKTAKKKADEA